MSVPSTFLDRVRETYTSGLGHANGSEVHNPWYILAAVAFSASNMPQAVPEVFSHVLNFLPKDPSTSLNERQMVARKLREALFKSGLLSGYPRAINSLQALHESMPDELKEFDMVRDTDTTLPHFQEQGKEYFDSVYGETAIPVRRLLRDIYPDLEWFSVTLGYGVVYSSRPDILTPLETSFTMLAALIAGDTPQQISWHLKGAHRRGASVEEVRAARAIAIAVAEYAGVTWKNIIPEAMI